MLKALSAALVAASLLAAPVLTNVAEAAQPAKTALTAKPVKVAIVKHKRIAKHHHRVHVKHVRHVGHWKWVKVHGKFVRIFVKKPTHKIVRKTATVIVKKPVVLKKSALAK
jgi:hypothetical protein